MIHEELTRKIIGASMAVHGKMGNGFQEVIYQRCLAIELTKNSLTFEREKEMDIYYDDRKVGRRRVDFFVEGSVMVELKSVIKLEPVHLAQALNYLEAYNMPVGLLINFGSRSLEFKRVLNKSKVSW